MTGVFKANNPYNNFLLLLYGLVLKLPMFIYPVAPKPRQMDGVFYEALLRWLSSAGNSAPFICSFIAFLLLYTQAISFNKVLNNQRLLPRPNYLAAMSYLLLTSLFTEWYTLSAPLVANTLLIWVLSTLCNVYNNPNAKTMLYNIGMATGLASLFYFPSIVFSLLVVVGIVITRPFKLPEWIVAFLGILTPYYFLIAWIVLTNRWKDYRFPTFSVTFPKFADTALAYITIIFVLVTIAIGMAFIQNNMRRLVVQSRKSWSLIYLYLLVAVFVSFLNATHSFDYWILTTVPAAAFAAGAFLFPERKWFGFFMHWSLVALSVVSGYFLR